MTMTARQWRELGVEPPKTAAQFKAEAKAAAEALPLETRREFWRLMREDGKTLGEAREAVGIDDIMVAAVLVIMCHERLEYNRPLDVEEIT